MPPPPTNLILKPSVSGPAPVHGRLAHPGAGRDGIHRQRAHAALRHRLDDGIEHGPGRPFLPRPPRSPPLLLIAMRRPYAGGVTLAGRPSSSPSGAPCSWHHISWAARQASVYNLGSNGLKVVGAVLDDEDS